VAFHAGLPVPGGFIGVDIFFVISGYVITNMLSLEWSRNGSINFRRFYSNRFKRLTPALALMVSSTLILSALLLSPTAPLENTAKTGLGAMLLVANLVIARTTGGYFDEPAATNPLLNTWSLSLEEQFYLVFPLVLLAGWMMARRFRSARSAPIAIIFAFMLGSFGAAFLAAGGHILPWMVNFVGFYSPFTRAWEFAAGAALLLVSQRWLAPSLRAAQTAGVFGGLLVLASLWFITSQTPFPGLWTLLPVSGAALLLFAGANSASPTSRILGSEPLVRIGDISYSWYLWHWPLIVLSVALWPSNAAVPLLAVCASVAPAFASYRWIEQPLRGLRSLQPAQWVRVITATMAPPLALSLALLLAAANGFWTDSIRSFNTAQSSYGVSLDHDCDAEPAGLRTPPPECTWNPQATGPPIYVVGDSNAIHFSDGVLGAAKELNRPVTFSTASGCPFVKPMEVPISEAGCAAFVDGTLQWLQTAKPGTVIIASSDHYWDAPESRAGLTNEGFFGVQGFRNEFLKPQLLAAVQELTEAGQQVLLVQTVPRFDTDPFSWIPKECNVWAVARGACVQQMPLDRANSLQQLARSAVNQVAVQTGSSVLDVQAALCPVGVCRTQQGNVINYRDGRHITVSASKSLTLAFADALSGNVEPSHIAGMPLQRGGI
jgi:peptidoglycan/LPS O-acetylase OafA/YrhL